VTNVRHPQLSGLGRNPAAPDDIIVRVAAHPAGRHGIDLRQGPLADAVVAAMLAHGGPNPALHGKRISPAMRRVIAEHPDPNVRDAFPGFVRETVDRTPSLLSIESLEEAYGQPREQLIRAADPKVRAAVARAWWRRPMDMQRLLLADVEPEVRARATELQQPGIPPDWRDRCLTDPATRVNAARYVPLTVEHALQLVDTGDIELHQAVAANPYLPAEAARLLQDSTDPLVLVGVAQSRHVNADIRDRIYAHLQAEQAAGNIDATIALTWNFTEPAWLRDEPLTVRLTYLDCPHAIFRRVLASCPDLPPHAWQRLDNDPNIGVRKTAARRTDAPAGVLEKLVREHGDDHHIRPRLVEHPTSPGTAYEHSSTNRARTSSSSRYKIPTCPAPRCGNSRRRPRRGCAKAPPATPTSTPNSSTASWPTPIPTSPTPRPPTPPSR
jgi:hypothetical protein